MTKIYNKEVINELEVDLFNRDYRIIVLDNPEQDTYDIHIITDHYQKDELNTLYLQKQRDDVFVDALDELYLTMIVTEFALWDKLYDYKGKSYTFSIKIEDACEL